MPGHTRRAATTSKDLRRRDDASARSAATWYSFSYALLQRRREPSPTVGGGRTECDPVRVLQMYSAWIELTAESPERALPGMGETPAPPPLLALAWPIGAP